MGRRRGAAIAKSQRHTCKDSVVIPWLHFRRNERKDAQIELEFITTLSSFDPEGARKSYENHDCGEWGT